VRSLRRPSPDHDRAQRTADIRRWGAGRTAATAGARDSIAVIVAYIPFALALGAALTSTTVEPFAAWSSSWLIFAGAAQLVAVQLLDSGAGALVVIATALVVNARHLLYSASMAPHTTGWPSKNRWLAPYFLADPVYALAAGRFEQTDVGGTAAARAGYYLGVGITCWAGWQFLTGIGAVLGGVMPEWLPLTLAAPLTFLLLLLPLLHNRATRTAAAIGGSAALAAASLPLGLGLLVGAVAGVVAGAWVGGRND
jgi:predicted branched-subunit amino acid permease